MARVNMAVSGVILIVLLTVSAECVVEIDLRQNFREVLSNLTNLYKSENVDFVFHIVYKTKSILLFFHKLYIIIYYILHAVLW